MTVTSVSVAIYVMRTVSAAAVGAFAGLGVQGGAGALVGLVAGAVLGAVHARHSARVEVYPPTRRGWWLLVVDSTWSAPNTIAGAVFLAVNLARGNRVVPAASRGRTSLVLERGVIGGFATTIGPVEAGTRPHIAPHEYVHVLQARIFGPAYFPLVGAHYVLVTVLPYWWLYHDHRGHPIRTVGDYFMKGVYPHVWNEEWAYRVAGNPP